MPTITINKKEFEKSVGKKLTLEELKDRISMLGTDLEGVDENEISVEIFPDRPDMLSEQGFARAFNSFIGVDTGLKKYKVKKSGYKVIVDKSVSMRPYTACAIVKNLKFDDEKIRQIMQIQEKLAVSHGRDRKKSAYGMYPSQGINFPIHYIAKDPKKVKFKPLGFDEEVVAAKIEEVHPKGREYKWVAEGWKKYPFFIDNKENVMCMLPYTNSEDTGKIDENTKEIFIECTGVDLRNIMIALNIFVTMLADMGGEIYSLDIVYPDKTIATPELTPSKMKLNLKYVNKILGLELEEKDVKKYLERMGYDYGDNEVKIPAYRADIISEIDLVEDIAVAYGYENFKEEIPKVATIAEEDKFEIFKNKISEILIGLNLMEVNTYHLVNKDINKKLNCGIKNLVLENSVSEEYNSLRSWMIPCLMEVLEKNKSEEYPQNIFEIGRVFKKSLEECDRLAVVLCDKDANFTKIKQVLDYLLDKLGLKYEIEEVEHGSFIPGRVGRVSINNKKVAYIGEIKPEVLEQFEIEMPVVTLELNLTELFEFVK